MIRFKKMERKDGSYLCKELRCIRWFGYENVHDHEIELREADVLPAFELMRSTLAPLYS